MWSGVLAGIGSFVFEKHTHGQVVYPVSKLTSPGRGSPCRVSRAPDVEASEYGNQRCLVQWCLLVWQGDRPAAREVRLVGVCDGGGESRNRSLLAGKSKKVHGLENLSSCWVCGEQADPGMPGEGRLQPFGMPTLIQGGMVLDNAPGDCEGKWSLDGMEMTGYIWEIKFARILEGHDAAMSLPGRRRPVAATLLAMPSVREQGAPSHSRSRAALLFTKCHGTERKGGI